MRFKGLGAKVHWVWILLLLVFFALSNTLAQAENQGQQREKSLEAWQKALLFSKDHPVVSFAIYGRIPNATAQEIADKIKDVLASHKIKSEYFLAKPNRMGASLGFYIQGVPYGPVGFDKVPPLIREVIEHFKQEYFTGS